MKRYIIVLIACAVVATKYAAADELSPAPKSNTIEWISIMTGTAWSLSVKGDGSGEIGFAGSPAHLHMHSFASFARGTFDFTNVCALVSRATSNGGTNVIIMDHIVLRSGQTTNKAGYVSANQDAMIALYTKAFDSAKVEGTLVEELRKRWPPFPHNQLSDRTR